VRHYIGVVYKDATLDYGVSFPDFPGAVAAAPALDEAVKMAVEALLLHVEGMLAEGDKLPEPSTREQVLANPEWSDGKKIWVAAEDRCLDA
jgi:predicted RNase H-like HicB family nuclease